MSSQQALEAFFDAVDDGNNVEGIMPSPIVIENGRDQEDLSLDTAGFEIINFPTSLTTGEFHRAQDDDGLKRQYFDEIVSYVERKLGCDKVVCIQMNTTNNGGTAVKTDQVRDMGDFYKTAKPQTATSSRVADELALAIAGEDHRYQRYAVLSLFRYIEDEEHHNFGQYQSLAVMDERTSVKPDDYITKERIAYGPEGTSTVGRYYALNPRHALNHKWYYFPDMNMHNDAVLMKEMDSDWTKESRMCFQMNVPDPKNGIPTVAYAQRKSTEVRMVCFWETPESGINSMPTAQQIMDTRPAKQSFFGTMQDSWVDKIMHGDSKVHEWLGKLESMSAGLMDGTDKLSFADLVAKATKCQSGTTVSPLKLNEDAEGNPEVYYGRYTKEYSDGYDEEYRKQYLEKFLEVVESFPTWPPSSKSWARNEMRRFGHREIDRGIAEITCVIVDDSMGLVGTKNFPTAEKRSIIDFLIRNETYMHVAMTHWAHLAYDAPLQNQQSIIEEEDPSEEDVDTFNVPNAAARGLQPSQQAMYPVGAHHEPLQHRDDIAFNVEGRRNSSYSMQQDLIPEEEQYIENGYDSRIMHHPQQRTPRISMETQFTGDTSYDSRMSQRRNAYDHGRQYYREEIPRDAGRYEKHRRQNRQPSQSSEYDESEMLCQIPQSQCDVMLRDGGRDPYEAIHRRRRSTSTYYDGEESAGSQTYYEENRSVMYSEESRLDDTNSRRMAHRESPDLTTGGDDSTSSKSYRRYELHKQRSIHHKGSSGRTYYDDDESHIYTHSVSSPNIKHCDQQSTIGDRSVWEHSSQPSF